jgi:lipopolysaccharide/colanic/teichoic acid biosynthesis glycosyltransferase
MPPRKTPVEQHRDQESRSSTGDARLQHSTRPEVPETERRRVIIVGAPEDVPRALQHPAAVSGRFEVAAVLAVDVESDDQDAGVTKLSALLASHSAETILVAGAVGAATLRRVADLALLNHCELLAVMPTEILAGHDPVVVWSGDSPLVQLARIPRRRWAFGIKRAIDIVGSAVGLVLGAPLFAVLAVAIRLESRGAIIFKHERVGRNGRKFRCLKFRTMRADAEAVLRADPGMYDEYRRNHYKIPDDQDARVTPLGRRIRRTSLDELPQLWNVFVGDMSLVGPRPVVEEELEHYQLSCELLLSVRPGITGAWAISGRHAVGYPERCELELAYVRRWTLAGDASALVRTIHAVVNPRSRFRRARRSNS